MSIAAALIDLDGTLLDTVPDIAFAANLMRQDLGLHPLREDVVASYIGKGTENLVQRCLNGHAQAGDPALLMRAHQTYLEHYERCNGEHTRLFDGVTEGLADMRRMGLRMAVVTNKPVRFSVPLLDGMGLSGFFDLLVGGDTCSRRKPDPEPMRHACEKLGVPVNRAVAIGDSINDAVSARSAGCLALAVPYGYNEGQDVRSLEVDAIVADLREAARWIASRL